jgi:hypothetical protein
MVVEREGIELDHCPRCRGLWFDAGELAVLAEKLGRSPAPTEDAALERAGAPEAPRSCPRCDRSMDKGYLGSAPRVLVDRCAAGHGLWFDHEELGALVSQMAAAPGSRPEALLQFMGEQFGTGTPPAESATAGEPPRSGEEKR